jgi:hypothetical protein
MTGRGRTKPEASCRLEHDFGADVVPRDVIRLEVREDRDLDTVDGNGAATRLDRAGKRP